MLNEDEKKNKFRELVNSVNPVDIEYTNNKEDKDDSPTNFRALVNQVNPVDINKSIDTYNTSLEKQYDKLNKRKMKSNIQDVDEKPKASEATREAANVLMNKKKLSDYTTEEEKLQQQSTREQQVKRIEEANSDKNPLSQIGKAIENFWLGITSGGKSAAYYATNTNHTKQQENELLANNKGGVVNLEYKAQLNKPDLSLIKNNNTSGNNPLIYQKSTLADPLQNNTSDFIREEDKQRIDKELDEHKDAFGELDLNPLHRNLSNSILEDQNKIANNINKIDNGIIKKIAELTPSTGNSLFGAGLSVANPYLGMSYFIVSASGSYEFDGRNRGMSKEKARAYGSIMGFVEGATEYLEVSHFMSTQTKAVRTGSAIKFLKNVGLDMADNAVQEAIIDPIDEFVASAISGKGKYDLKTREGWNQLGIDMVEDTINGALSSILMGGMDLGIGSCMKVYDNIKNGKNPTPNEWKAAFLDVQKSKKINIKEKFKEAFKYEKEKATSNRDIYTMTDIDNQGNVVGLTQTIGESIDLDNEGLQVSPVVVYTDGYYNIIDGISGLKLDTTLYESKQHAINSFKEKISKADTASINEINRQAVITQLVLEDKFREMQEIAEQNPGEMQRQTRIEFVQDNKIYSTSEAQQILNDYGINTSVNNRQYLGQELNDMITHSTFEKLQLKEDFKNNGNYMQADYNASFEKPNTNTAQTSSEPNRSNFYTAKSNYAVEDIKKVTEPFNAKQEYTIDEMAEIWNNEIAENEYDVTYDNNGNIKSYIAIEEDNGNLVVNQYDNEDNIVKSEVISANKGKYTSEAIKDTLEKVSSLYDENRPIKGQQDIEGNEVRSMKNNKKEGILSALPHNNMETRSIKPSPSTNNISQNEDIVKSIENFKKAKKTADRQDIINIANNLNIYHRGTTFIDKHMQNKSSNKLRPTITEIDEFFKEYKDKEDLRKQAYDYALQNYKNKKILIEDINEYVDIPQSGLKKTFHQNQDNIKMQSANNLLEIIKNSEYLNSSISTKNSTLIYHYFISPIRVNNNNQIALVTIREDTTNKKDNSKFYYHDIRNINNIKESKAQAMPHKKVSNMLFERFSPSIDNSIPQKTNSVKNDTAINKQSMQKSENNTNTSKENTKSIKSLEQKAIERELHNRIQNAIISKNSKGRTYLGNVSNKVANKVKSLFNIETLDRRHVLADNDIRHMIKEHGNPEIEKTKGQIAITVEDIEKIPEILNNYNRIVAGNDNKQGKTIRYIKNYSDNVSYVVEVVPEKGNALKIKTMWKKPVRVTNSLKTPSSTSKTKSGLSSSTSKLSITQNRENVKDDGVRSMKKSNITSSKTQKDNTLIAQHNTSEEKILEALELGALPVPSIAVTKYQNPVSNYGDITLLFNKDTVNPTDKRNVTYNSDIYSTRKPQTANMLNKQKVKSFEKVATDNGISYGYLNTIEEYIQNDDLIKARDIIKYQLQKTNSNITDQEIENVYTEALKCIQEKRIMKPGVDPYTPSGNRKTIQQMSVPYTLDNIVQIMTKKNTKGSESNTFAGLAEVRANLSQKFKSIEAMHNSENNLISSKEMENLKAELNDTFYNLLDEIGKYDSVDRYWGSSDVIANAINETAKSKNITIDVLDNELDYVSIKNVPQNILQKTVDFLNSLKDIPTEYFEAKPQRAVGFDEVQKAIVPVNTSKEVIDRLTAKGIEIEYYKTQDERMKKISNTENIRFAKRTAKDIKNKIDKTQRNAEREGSYIEQEIRKIEATGQWDNSIPITKLTDIRKTIEDYLGLRVKKGHFRQAAYAIYKGNRDVIRTKEFKDMDSVLHEVGHALDIGNRLKIDKESIANELLKAIDKLGGYENETREVRLEEGFAEVIREYSIVPEQAKSEYPLTIAILEKIRQNDKGFDKFITKVQQQTYNYIHQNPENRVLSNQSIGEQTDKVKWSKEWIKQVAIEHMFDKDYVVKSSVETLQKINGKTVNQLNASKNAYYITRLSNATGDKAISMLTDGYIDEKGNKIMPGLNQIGEIFEQEATNMGLKGKEKTQAIEQRFNDLRAYLVAKRDTDYKSKSLKTGMRSMDTKAVIEQFENDTQIQQTAKIVYDTLDGMLQYAVDNGVITQESAESLKESNAFYVPMQRVLESNGNQVGRKGAVADIIKKRTGSELDVKDVLENIIANSVNIVQQVENNNALKALYNQGQEAGITGAVYDVIDTPMVKIGTARLSTWEIELRMQGVDISKLDLEKTIDLFAPNNKVDTKNRITSFINDDGKRVYLQFNDDVLFSSIMGLDTESTSNFLNIVNNLNTPLRYGATMANIGFAIPNMISDTAQAAIFSTAGFIPIVDNALGVLDVLTATNKTVNNFMNKVAPEYAKRINQMYSLYQQSGASSGTRIAQERKSVQNLMSNVYGSDNLGIDDKFKPLKRLLDLMTYIPEISEQSTRFEVFKKNYDYYKGKGNAEMDARIMAALESRDATQDFSRMGKTAREINKLIPFSAARIGSSYTFAEKIKANPKQVTARIAVLSAIALAIKGLAGDDKEIEELNQRKKDDNFVFKVGDTIVTIKKPQGILRSMVNLTEYIYDLATGHIEEGKEGERLVNWLQNAIMDNMPADDVTGLVPSALTPFLENAINYDLYYHTNIVKSYDLELPDEQQYYDYNSQVAIWLGQIFNYSPAKIDNWISGYFGGLGTQATNAIDTILGKTGITVEKPDMGAESNAVGKRFVVNVNSNSTSIDEIYNLKTELTKKKNGGTITDDETEQLETIKSAISSMSNLNKQIKEIKKDLSLSGKEKAEQIKLLQQEKTDTARQALGKDLINSSNNSKIQSTQFYLGNTLKKSNYTLTLTKEQKKEYEQIANEYYSKYKKQGLYSKEKLKDIKSKAKDYAKNKLMQKYKSSLIKTNK